VSTSLVLAVDVGTTNCKTLLLDRDLNVVAKVSREYPVAVPRPGWSEQHPDDWWDAVEESIGRVVAQKDPAAIKAVGLSGQMHGLVVLDGQGHVLRPAILWNDQRSAPQCQAIYERAGGKGGLVDHTNNAMLPGYTGGKILWLRDHEPAIYGQIAALLLPKDYVRFRLTGDKATDVSDASGTGLFDVRARQWAHGLTDLLDIPGEWFPPVFESDEFTGTVGSAVAAETGLLPGTPVIAGGGDAVMQTVGGGAVQGDVVLIVIGTGGNVTVSTSHAIENPDANLQVFCHVVPERWVAMGVTLSAGNALKWFRDTLGGLERALSRDLHTDPYELLSRQAALAPAGACGLLFLPYLQGERCPHTDVHARGTFVGLSLHTSKADMVRSVMEGVTFSLRDVLELILKNGAGPDRIHASGGGSSSAVWRQIQADIFNRPVTTLDHSEDASAIGAGIIAGVACGLWASAEEAVSLIRTRTVDHPNAANAERYDRLFAVYRSLYPALRPAFDALTGEMSS
jgi:xylulokinase